MIVLLSYSGDQIANDVMDWLQTYDCQYKRINLEEEDYRKLSVTMKGAVSQLHLELKDGSTLKLEEVSAFFFRGGLFKSDVQQYRSNELSERMIRTHLSYEFNTLVGFFYREISKKCLGAPIPYPVNKLQQLQVATETGLCIPETIIRSSKAGVHEWLSKRAESLITKSIQENVLLQDALHLQYDLKVQGIKQSELPACFFPSLFQFPVKKSIEVRTFYLEGKFYSLAMLLSAAEETVIDYRNFTDKIRYARYKLPTDIEVKLDRFMKKMNLNTGSLDLILDDTGTCYFLEVNPTGQIGWVSNYGSYFLEEKIARYLFRKELNFKKNEAISFTG